MKKRTQQLRIPIEGMSRDDFEFAVAHIAAVEFGCARRGYRELTSQEQAILENDDGRLAEIIERFELKKYEVLRAILWDAVIAHNNDLNTKTAET